MPKYLRKYIHIFSQSKLSYIITLVAASIFSFNLYSQDFSDPYLIYIGTYKDLAILHQQEYGIPASITLAQGLLESNAGNSPLAIEGNNHFGIKCKGWTGDSIHHDDDELQECFRKYNSASQSFEDHARFLKRKRYAVLFTYDITDYKSWANGLSKCGYATDKKYPEKLMSIIERYELYKYDIGQKIVATRKNLKGDESLEHSIDQEIIDEFKIMHNIRRKWGLHYVVAHTGDSYSSIAQEFGLRTEQLLNFNDIESKNSSLSSGTILYLQKKEKCAAEGYNYHIVNPGESLHDIAQYYGIRLKELLRMNNLRKNYSPEAGEEIRLR